MTTWLIATLMLVGSQAPLPAKLVEAKTLCIVNAGTKQEYVDKLATELRKARRFELVAEEDAADVLVLLGEKNSGAATVPIAGLFLTIEGEGFAMVVVDPESERTLWSDSQEVGWTYGGAISALVKRLHKRLEKEK